jgi:hypothetical protein
MPFGDISLPPGAIQQPNIAGGFLSGMLGMQELQTSQARADALQSLAQREQQKLAEESRWDEAVKANLSGPDQEQGLAALYKINPERAMGLAKSQYEVNKLKAEGGRIGADTQGKQIENEGKNADIAKQEAVGAAHYMKAMGANANPQALAGYLIARSKTWGDRNPEVARQLQEAAGNPDVLPHIMAAAKAGGYKDPDEEMQRDVSASNQKAAYQQGLGPTPYQQQQLGLQQQSTHAELGNKANERANALRKQFEGLEEVQTYRTVAPLMQGLYSSAQLDNKAGDLGLIYGVARVLDPKGVVRESDAGLVGGTGSWFEDLAGQYNAVKGGARLSPDVRAKLLEMATGKTNALKQAYDVARDNYAGIAQRQGIALDDMAFGTMTPQGGQPAQGQAPAPAGGLPEGRVAINPATGQRMIVRNGQLVPQ